MRCPPRGSRPGGSSAHAVRRGRRAACRDGHGRPPPPPRAGRCRPGALGPKDRGRSDSSPEQDKAHQVAFRRPRRAGRQVSGQASRSASTPRAPAGRSASPRASASSTAPSTAARTVGGAGGSGSSAPASTSAIVPVSPACNSRNRAGQRLRTGRGQHHLVPGADGDRVRRRQQRGGERLDGHRRSGTHPAVGHRAGVAEPTGHQPSGGQAEQLVQPREVVRHRGQRQVGGRGNRAGRAFAGSVLGHRPRCGGDQRLPPRRPTAADGEPWTPAHHGRSTLHLTGDQTGHADLTDG